MGEGSVEILGVSDSGDPAAPERCDPPRRLASGPVMAVLVLVLVLGTLNGFVRDGGNEPADAGPESPPSQGPAPAPLPMPDRIDAPSVTGVDLGQLAGPVAVGTEGRGSTRLWFLRGGAITGLRGLHPQRGLDEPRTRLHWWHERVALIDDGHLVAVHTSHAGGPIDLGPAVFAVPSGGREHVWSVPADPTPGAVVIRHRVDGEVASLWVPYGAWIAMGAAGGLVTVDEASGWWYRHPGRPDRPLTSPSGLVPIASRGELVFFIDQLEWSEVVVVDVLADRVVARHDVTANLPGHPLAAVCPSPDGRHLAIDIGDRVVVVRTDSTPTDIVTVVDHRGGPLAWDGPDRLLYLSTSPTARMSSSPLAVLHLGGARSAERVVAELDGLGPWLLATPDGTC